jgi:hypothetical protein
LVIYSLDVMGEDILSRQNCSLSINHRSTKGPITNVLEA